MSLIASLPWYDLPASKEKLNVVWTVLRSQLVERGIKGLPESLDRNTVLNKQWSAPELVISQCCGPDLFTPEGKDLVPIARPVFADLDCEPGNYFSHIVTADPRLQRPNVLAVNALSSRSGCTALLEWLDSRYAAPFEIVVSGSHIESIRLLNEGVADMAAVDGHTFKLVDTQGVSIIGKTKQAPSPPFVTHRDSMIDSALLFDALHETIRQVGWQVGIQGVVSTDHSSYASLEHDAELSEHFTANADEPVASRVNQ